MKCYYDTKNGLINIEENESTAYGMNCLLNKLRKCMEKSDLLRKYLPPDIINEMCEICKAAESMIDATKKSICIIREKIERMNKIQEGLGLNPEPTAYIYMERIIHSLRVSSEYHTII